TAEHALALGLGGGSLIAVLFVWWLWRSRGENTQPIQRAKAEAKPQIATVPTLAQLTAWPTNRVRGVVAALFENAGYKARLRPSGGEANLELLRPNMSEPVVLICCLPGAAGMAGPRVVRELFAGLVSSGVDAGWVISPGGFSSEARAEATDRGITLINGEELIERLAKVPPEALFRVLAGGDE
ncbi:MAG: hypothetical protein RLZZ15_3646, partial [Verrucomicrobiota bacterium]